MELFVSSTDIDEINWKTEFFKEAQKLFSALALAKAPVEQFTFNTKGMTKFESFHEIHLPEFDNPAKSNEI